MSDVIVSMRIRLRADPAGRSEALAYALAWAASLIDAQPPAQLLQVHAVVE